MAKQKKRHRRAPVVVPQKERATAARLAPILPWAGPALIALATVGMLVLSWGTWPDVVVDFGREVYVPWRLAEGDVLYRDLAYFNGPLSPYVNALWFRLFGASLRVLIIANLAILTGILALLYRLLLDVGSRGSALLGCLVVVVVFAFARYTTGGNYNYLCPYAHEMTHGLLLSLAAFYFVARYTHSGHWRDVAGAGACVGLAALTKPELFLAALIGTLVGIGLSSGSAIRFSPRVGTKVVAAYFAALAAPIMIAVALLSTTMSPSAALAHSFAAVRWSFSPEIAGQVFYRYLRGTDAIGHNLAMLGIVSLGYLVVLGVPAGVALFEYRSRAIQIAVALACFVGVGLTTTVLMEKFEPRDVVRPLSLVVLVSFAAMLIASLRRTQSGSRIAPMALSVALTLFALLLLAKIMFFVRITHYGFVLSLPATMVFVVALWNGIPTLISRRGGSQLIFRSAALSMILFASLRFLDVSRSHYQSTNVRVGKGGDAFYADYRGHEVNRLLAEIDRIVPPDGTLAGVPEGAMFNYLSRRRTSLPYITFMPIEMIMFGEEQILSAFERHPPDFLIGSDENAIDYGFKQFGRGYAEKLYAWIMQNFAPVGREPRPDGSIFHALLMKRIVPTDRQSRPSSEASPAPLEGK